MDTVSHGDKGYCLTQNIWTLYHTWIRDTASHRDTGPLQHKGTYGHCLTRRDTNSLIKDMDTTSHRDTETKIHNDFFWNFFTVANKTHI